jgi:arylsulfatase A
LPTKISRFSSRSGGWVTHTPDGPTPEPYWSDTAAAGINENPYRIRSMMQHMDTGVGDIFGTLDRLGMAGTTLVFFTRNNGASGEG